MTRGHGVLCGGALNTLALAVYLGWLARQDARLLYAQDGALYFLPLVPFLLVYLGLLRPGGAPPAEEEGGHD